MHELLVSSDGKSIITWDLLSREMLVKWPCFDDDGIVNELVIIDPKSCSLLEEKYTNYLLITRSYHELKVCVRVSLTLIAKLVKTSFLHTK